jgi:hypothetical protein
MPRNSLHTELAPFSQASQYSEDLLPPIDWTQEYHPNDWSVSQAGDRILIIQDNATVSIARTELVGLWVAMCRSSGA